MQSYQNLKVGHFHRMNVVVALSVEQGTHGTDKGEQPRGVRWVSWWTHEGFPLRVTRQIGMTRVCVHGRRGTQPIRARPGGTVRRNFDKDCLGTCKKEWLLQ